MPSGFQEVEATRFQDFWHMKVVRLSALHTGHLNLLRKYSWYSFLLEAESTSRPYTGHFKLYSGITKIYYRKTAGHIFVKTVQIEGTTQNIFFPVSCFSLKFTFLLLGDASVCSAKMAAPG